MFTLSGNWKLIAVLKVEGDSSRVFILGWGGMPSEEDLNDPEQLLRHGYILFEIQDNETVKSMIEAGLTSKDPMLVTGFTFSKLLSKANNGEKPFDFTVANSFVQSKDGKFESQYTMCESCNHPVSATVTANVTQGILDRINTGETVEIESGNVSYSCGNCGYFIQRPYRDLRIWKTLSSHQLSFEEAKKKIGVRKEKPVRENLEIEMGDRRPEPMHFGEILADRPRQIEREINLGEDQLGYEFAGPEEVGERYAFEQVPPELGHNVEGSMDEERPVDRVERVFRNIRRR